MKLILASTSKYRRAELLKLAIAFEAQAPQFNEDDFKNQGHSPWDLSRLLALGKANSLLPHYQDEEVVILGSDQVAHLDDQTLSKPGNFERARDQLMLMQGKTHALTTSVALVGSQGSQVIFTNVTKLTMRKLTLSEVEDYLKKDEPYDCAGSYKIESYGIALFSAIETDDFTAITGLPLLRLGQELRALGF